MYTRITKLGAGACEKPLLCYKGPEKLTVQCNLAQKNPVVQENIQCYKQSPRRGSTQLLKLLRRNLAITQSLFTLLCIGVRAK